MNRSNYLKHSQDVIFTSFSKLVNKILRHISKMVGKAFQYGSISAITELTAILEFERRLYRSRWCRNIEFIFMISMLAGYGERFVAGLAEAEA